MFTAVSSATAIAESVSLVERESVGASCSSIQRLRRRQVAPHAGTTAFVFSGGGARGALHVGALRALLEAGIHPDMLVGTSVGAWNAAWLAHAPTLDGVEALADIWRRLHTDQILLGQRRSFWSRARALPGLLLLAALRRIAGGCSSLYSDTGLRRLLSQRFADLAFEDLDLPLSVIATDLSRGGRAVFQHGTIVDALLASSAIPGVFPPVSIDGALYADGGIVDGCSVETAIELGARRIFILAIGYDAEAGDGALWAQASEQATAADRGAPRRSAPSAPSVLQRASQVMGNYQIQRALERMPLGIEAHLISLSSGAGGTLSFGHVDELIECAYQSTRIYLENAYTRGSDDARQLAEVSVSALSA